MSEEINLFIPSMKVTQKDIAKRIGVSTSLVSRVLSGQAHKIGVHPKKIEDIIRVAKELNYVPSPAALVLKGKKSRTIGVVVYDFHDAYFSLLINEIQQLAHDNNYSVLLVGFLNRKPEESDLLPLYKHFVDGIIILGSYGDLSWTDAFKEIPITRIGHGEHQNLKLTISIDEADAMRKILNHLVNDLKLSKIKFIARDLPAQELRRNTFISAASEFKCDLQALELQHNASDFKTGTICARELLSKGHESLPHAIVCATDTIAMGVIRTMWENGIRVPDDIVVIGYDDIPAAATYIPAITSFRQPIKIFAQRCFKTIIDNPEPYVANIEGELIIRKSSLKSGQK